MPPARRCSEAVRPADVPSLRPPAAVHRDCALAPFRGQQMPQELAWPRCQDILAMLASGNPSASISCQSGRTYKILPTPNFSNLTLHSCLHISDSSSSPSANVCAHLCRNTRTEVGWSALGSHMGEALRGERAADGASRADLFRLVLWVRWTFPLRCPIYTSKPTKPQMERISFLPKLTLLGHSDVFSDTGITFLCSSLWPPFGPLTPFRPQAPGVYTRGASVCP